MSSRFLLACIATALVSVGVAALEVPPSAPSGPPQANPTAGRLNRLIELFEQKKPAFGIFVSDPSVRKAVNLATSDLDFVIVDMEHAPLDFDRLEAFLASFVDRRSLAAKGTVQPDVVPIVRLAPYGREKLHFTIKQALDLGAYGLMLPFVETAEQALSVVRGSRYPQRRGAPDREPIGQRGAAYGFAATLWGLTPAEYAERADVWPLDPKGELCLMIQIETAKGVANVDDILSVPGVSSIFIGPADLAFSLGVDPGHPDHELAIQRVLAACRRKGVPCGITATADTVVERIREGFSFVTLGGDRGLESGVVEALRAAEQAGLR